MMKDPSTDVLIEFHKIQVARSEHYEKERSSLSGLVLTVASALVVLATYDGEIAATDWLLGLLIVLNGTLGLVGSRLHYFRALRHGRRASAYRAAVAGAFPSVDAIKRKVDVEHDQHGMKSDLRLHHVWMGLHGAIIVVGLVVMILSISS